MKALAKRHIRITDQFDHLIPPSTVRDTVVVGAGKATLDDTLVLMEDMISSTLTDTKALAKHLKGATIKQSCKHIWNFVYQHIQYTMDATGIEQVRRPSRTWTDRLSGVDCDCYTVFIGSILTNLGIPFKMRLTKYKNRKQFQHVYPIVPTSSGHITIDCVTDQFNYEEPYSEKKDVPVNSKASMSREVGTLSGVDELAITLNAIEQPSIPLRKIITSEKETAMCIVPTSPMVTKTVFKQAGKVLSPFRFGEQKKMKTILPHKKIYFLPWLLVSGATILAGLGFWQVVSSQKKNSKTYKK